MKVGCSSSIGPCTTGSEPPWQALWQSDITWRRARLDPCRRGNMYELVQSTGQAGSRLSSQGASWWKLPFVTSLRHHVPLKGAPMNTTRRGCVPVQYGHHLVDTTDWIGVWWRETGFKGDLWCVSVTSHREPSHFTCDITSGNVRLDVCRLDRFICR